MERSGSESDVPNETNEPDRPPNSHEPARDTNPDQEQGQAHEHPHQPPQVTVLSSTLVVPVDVPGILKIIGVTKHGTPLSALHWEITELLRVIRPASYPLHDSPP